jgi:hypothetical protein
MANLLLFKNPFPNWSGCMQLLYNNQSIGYSNGKATITFLLIIDISPSDMNFIFSTFRYLSSLAYNFKKPTVITFDQPLYWKASKIITSTDDPIIKKIVLTLGTFHTVMNLLGAIGTLMENTGLSSILETV